MASQPANRTNMVVRLAAMSIPLALLLYNVGACLYSALTGTPIQVWAGDSGAIVAIPGVPIEGEPAPPGSRLWWMILGSYGLPLIVLSVVIARRVRAKQRAREAELHERSTDDQTVGARQQEDLVARKRATALDVPPRPRPSGTRRIHVLDPKIVGRMGGICLAMWGCIGALVLVSRLHGRGPNDLLTESSGSHGSGFIYAGIYAIGFAILWLGFWWALRTVAVFSPTGLVLERNGRRLWGLLWDDIHEWWRELGPNGQLRAVVLRRHRGAERRINVGWIGLGSGSYGELLSEVGAWTGMDESPPVTVKGSRAGSFIALGIIAVVVISALIILFSHDIYEKIIYWGIR